MGIETELNVKFPMNQQPPSVRLAIASLKIATVTSVDMSYSRTENWPTHVADGGLDEHRIVPVLFPYGSGRAKPHHPDRKLRRMVQSHSTKSQEWAFPMDGLVWGDIR